MRIAVINFSGNVGKTTVSRHLLAPRLNNAPVVSVESANKDGRETEVMTGDEFDKLSMVAAMQDDVVADIGASNAELFFDALNRYAGSHVIFDYYIVPVIPTDKCQADTINTIDGLRGIGVEPKKIRIVFNQVKNGKSVEELFGLIFDYHGDSKAFVARPGAAIRTNELYDKLKQSDKSIDELAADNTDYMALIKEAGDVRKRVQLMNEFGMRNLAVGAKKQLDEVFDVLMKR